MNRSNVSSQVIRAVVGFLFLVCLIGCAASSGSNLIGKPAPYTRITHLDGDTVALDQFVGKGTPVVIAFWATTCVYSPSVVEKLDHLAATLKGRGIQFLAVSIDKSGAINDIRNMVKYRDMKNLTHFFSGNDVYDEAFISFDGGQLPYIVILNGQGTIVATGNKAGVVEDYFQAS